MSSQSIVLGLPSAAAIAANTASILALQSQVRGRAWTWANAAARIAQSGLVAADIGKRGYQTDMDLAYELLAVTPAVRWGRLEDSSMGPVSGAYAGNGTLSVSGLALVVGAITGTLSQRLPTANTKSSRLKRTAMTSGAVAGNTVYQRAGGGSSNGVWGLPFRYRATLVTGVVSASMRWAYGHYDVLGSNVDTAPTASGFLLNAVAYGADRNLSQNLQIYTNDGAGAAVATDLGASFPINASDLGYEIEFYSDGTVLNYQALSINTGAEVSGTISSNLPADGLPLNHGFYSTNHNDAAAISIDVNQITIQERHR
jgi:hypothetical protein